VLLNKDNLKLKRSGTGKFEDNNYVGKTLSTRNKLFYLYFGVLIIVLLGVFHFLNKEDRTIKLICLMC